MRQDYGTDRIELPNGAAREVSPLEAEYLAHFSPADDTHDRDFRGNGLNQSGPSFIVNLISVYDNSTPLVF